MTDEIKQQLGFDVTDALAALAKLDTALGTFQGGLTGTGEAMATWNSKAEATVQMLKALASGATSAASAMSKLQSAFGNGGPGAGPAGKPLGPNDIVAGAGFAGGTAAAVPPPPPLPPVVPSINPKPIDDAEKAAAKFIVTWETLSRVVMTQLIVRALSAMRDAMHEAFESNLQFMTRIAEIQSVAPGVGASLDSISQRVANLSREFNTPLAQVAEAQYQTLSNQFTTTAQQSDVMTAALKLSKVAVMDAGHAVNLIAGALNAYHMESTQAESVAASFFGAIQIGRVRGEELASVLSKVMAVSSQLGVSLQEVNAMMVTMTVSGVKPAEAATSLRASMMALLKPSADLKKELRELGYESGEQMIAALGLEGALLKLRNTTDESLAAFVKLIPNVRASAGALIETSDGGKKAAEAIAHLREMTVAAFNEKYKIYIDSDAQKVSADLNKLKVALTTDLGASLVSAVSTLFGFAGGADAVSAALKALTPVVGTAVAVFIAYAGTLATVSLAHNLVKASMTGVGTALVGLTAALLIYAAIDFGSTRRLQGLADEAAAYQKASQERLDNARAEAQQRTDIEAVVNQQIAQETLQGLATQRQSYFNMVDGIKEANKSLQESSHDTMLKLVDGAEKQVHQLREVASQAQQSIDAIEKAKVSIRDRFYDSEYRSRVNSVDSGLKARLREIEQSGDSSKSKARQREEAQDDAEAAKRAIARRSANELLDKSSRAGPSESGLHAAERAEHYASLAGNEKLVQEALNRQLTIENQLEAIAAKRAAWATARAAAEEAQVTTMREAAKAITKDMDLFDKKGSVMSPEDRASAQARVEANLKVFQGALFGSQKFDASQFMSFKGLESKLRESMNGAVTGTEVKKLWAMPGALSALNEQITQGLGPVRVRLLARLDHPEKHVNDSMDQLFHAVEEETKNRPAAQTAMSNARDDESQSLGRILVQQRAISAEIAKQGEEMKGIGGLGLALKTGLGRMGDMFFGEGASDRGFRKAAQDFASLNDAIQRLSARPLDITAESLAKVVEKAAQVKKELPPGLGWKMEGVDRNLASLQKIFDEQQKINKTHQQYPNLDQQQGQGQDALDRERSLNMMQWMESLRGKTSQIEPAINGDSEAMVNFEDRIQSAIGYMGELAQAAASVPAPGGGGMYSAKGGMAFLAGGGYPRGTDVIPAMLSKGEMVMSASTTRKFASQLTAMNAGVKPSYHSHGGSVTNIGDINVSVEGGNSGRQTARSIATELRRELRRGTSVL